MENSQLVSLSSLTALERKLGVIANNVANLNTTGFKAEELPFEEYLSPTASAESFENPDQDVYFVLDAQSVSNFSEGPISTTGNQLDVAIKGEGFFVVQTPAGERYSRDGSFTIDAEGQLTTHDGHPILGDSGPIVFSAQDIDVTITSEGVVSSNTGELGRLQIVGFNNPQLLTRIGNNLFSADDTTPQPVESPQVIQNALEGANVDPIGGISQMIQVQRAYQEVVNIVRSQNELREQAIQQLGVVQTNA